MQKNLLTNPYMIKALQKVGMERTSVCVCVCLCVCVCVCSVMSDSLRLVPQRGHTAHLGLLSSTPGTLSSMDWAGE